MSLFYLRRPYLCPSKGHRHGVSIQSFVNLGKTSSVSEYLAHEISHSPDFSPGVLYTDFFPFPRFWAFCIEWFWFLFFMARRWKQRIDRRNVHSSSQTYVKWERWCSKIPIYPLHFLKPLEKAAIESLQSHKESKDISAHFSSVVSFA